MRLAGMVRRVRHAGRRDPLLVVSSVGIALLAALAAFMLVEQVARHQTTATNDNRAKRIDPEVLFAIILKWLTKERQ